MSPSGRARAERPAPGREGWFRFARGRSRRAPVDAFGAARAPVAVVASGPVVLLALAAERQAVRRM